MEKYGGFVDMDKVVSEKNLTYQSLLKLKRWNTPTVYDGRKQITRYDRTRGHFNPEALRQVRRCQSPD